MFAVDDDNVNEMYDWIKENLEYNKISIGVHVNASRKHVHFGLTGLGLPIVKDQRKLYNRKGLNKVHPDIKLSMHKEPTEDDNTKCLAYPLKEYNHFDKIKYRDKINIEDNELENLRIYGHNIYCSSKYLQNKKEERREAADNRLEKLFNYVMDKIKKFMHNDPNYGTVLKPEWDNVGRLYIEVCKIICDYNLIEEQKKAWRWTDIGNQAYSFMYRISNEESNVNNRAIIMFQQKLKIKI